MWRPPGGEPFKAPDIGDDLTNKSPAAAARNPLCRWPLLSLLAPWSPSAFAETETDDSDRQMNPVFPLPAGPACFSPSSPSPVSSPPLSPLRRVILYEPLPPASCSPATLDQRNPSPFAEPPGPSLSSRGSPSPMCLDEPLEPLDPTSSSSLCAASSGPQECELSVSDPFWQAVTRADMLLEGEAGSHRVQLRRRNNHFCVGDSRHQPPKWFPNACRNGLSIRVHYRLIPTVEACDCLQTPPDLTGQLHLVPDSQSSPDPLSAIQSYTYFPVRSCPTESANSQSEVDLGPFIAPVHKARMVSVALAIARGQLDPSQAPDVSTGSELVRIGRYEEAVKLFLNMRLK